MQRNKLIHSTFFVGVLMLLPAVSGIPDRPLVDPVSECTIAVLSGRVTSDGRPLLWKNRDTAAQIHVLHHNTDGPLKFTGIVYPDSPEEFWSGSNEAGFAIMNSLPANGTDSLSTGLGNGQLMALALHHCVTLADFEALLNSTDGPGRRSLSNFGAIDAFGGAAFYECRNHSWNKEDVGNSTSGWAVRSNFSYVGDTILPHYGVYRHDRARSLIGQVLESGATLDWNRILNDIALDVLPEAGLEDGSWIANDETLCRAWTHSSSLLRGRLLADDPMLIFTRPGFPALSAPIPWALHLGEVPPRLGIAAGSSSFSRIVQSRAMAVMERVDGRYHILRSALFPQWSQDLSSDLYTSWQEDSQAGSQCPNDQWFRDWADRAVVALDREQWPIEQTEEPAESLPANLQLLGQWPNPFNAGFRIRWSQEEAAPVEIRLFDLRGRRVYYSGKQNQGAGEHSQHISPGKLASGVYLLSLQSGNERQVERVTHLK